MKNKEAFNIYQFGRAWLGKWYKQFRGEFAQRIVQDHDIIRKRDYCKPPRSFSS